ncbi:MAG: lipopolysaccharide heptosyltransferase II [Planctomycetes bacterium]|nr:lipopolysaccharide heptosyltransferase II [Planctomycetota bacterium]
MPLPETLNHLLILMPSWVGDVVMSSCVWKMARRKYPNAKITGVIRPHLAPLLDGITEFDEVLPLDMKSSVFTAAKQLRSVEGDAIVLLPNSFRSALIARLAKVPVRGGYKRDRRSWLLTDGVIVLQQHKPTPTSEYYLHLANELFGMNEKPTLPTMGTCSTQIDVLNEFSKPIVLFVAGASKSEKRWAPDKFAKVADALSELGATCCAIGSPDEHVLVQKIVDAAQAPVHDLTQEEITLGTLQAVVQQASVMITNDTGPRHLAVASGTPTITVYGPTDYRWTKYDCSHDIPVLSDPFLPEELIANSNPHRCDINNIPASDVIAIAKQFIYSTSS